MASGDWQVLEFAGGMPAARGKRKRGDDTVGQAQIVAAFDLVEEMGHNVTFTAVMIAELVDRVLDGSACPASREAFRERCHKLRELCVHTNRSLQDLREPASAA